MLFKSVLVGLLFSVLILGVLSVPISFPEDDKRVSSSSTGSKAASASDDYEYYDEDPRFHHKRKKKKKRKKRPCHFRTEDGRTLLFTGLTVYDTNVFVNGYGGGGPAYGPGYLGDPCSPGDLADFGGGGGHFGGGHFGNKPGGHFGNKPGGGHFGNKPGGHKPFGGLGGGSGVLGDVGGGNRPILSGTGSILNAAADAITNFAPGQGFWDGLQNGASQLYTAAAHWWGNSWSHDRPSYPSPGNYPRPPSTGSFPRPPSTGTFPRPPSIGGGIPPIPPSTGTYRPPITTGSVSQPSTSNPDSGEDYDYSNFGEDTPTSSVTSSSLPNNRPTTGLGSFGTRPPGSTGVKPVYEKPERKPYSSPAEKYLNQYIVKPINQSIKMFTRWF